MKKSSILEKYSIITTCNDTDFIKLVRKKKALGFFAPLGFGVPMPVESYYYKDYKSKKRYSDDDTLFLPRAKQGLSSNKPVSYFVDEELAEKIKQNGMTPEIADEILEIATKRMAK